MDLPIRLINLFVCQNHFTHTQYQFLFQLDYMGNQLNELPKTTISHPRFGNISTIASEGDVYMILDILVHNQSIQKEWKKNYQKCKDLKQFQCVLKPLKYDVEKIPCGLSRTLKMYFSYFPFVLKSEIQTRIQLNTPFQEVELFYLLLMLIEISYEFEKNNQKSGNIKPENILINSEGQINLITKHSFPGVSQNYVASLYDKEITYLAPEQMQFLHAQFQSPIYNKPKSQSFSIGLTLLQLGLLQDIIDIYNFVQKKINFSKLQQFLSVWKQEEKYSPFFKNCILYLLQINPTSRLSPGQMFAYLSPYDNQIRNLEQFQGNIHASENALSIFKNKNPIATENNKIKQINHNNHQNNNVKQSANIIIKQPVIHQLGSKSLKNSLIKKSQKTTQKPNYHLLNSAATRTNTSNIKSNPTVVSNLVPIVNFSYQGQYPKSKPINYVPPSTLKMDTKINGEQKNQESLKKVIESFRSQLSNKKMNE